MKLALLVLLLLATPFVRMADAQQASPPKTPPGVPADAKPFNGKWYRVYTEKLTWNRAKERCANMGGRLAIIPDAATWEFVKKLSNASLWLGATDAAKEGTWKWVDGSTMSFSVWITNNPNNLGGAENYLAMVTHDKVQGWNDFAKDGKTHDLQVSGFVCEWVPK
jgi:hypothetical protein